METVWVNSATLLARILFRDCFLLSIEISLPLYLPVPLQWIFSNDEILCPIFLQNLDMEASLT